MPSMLGITSYSHRYAPTLASRPSRASTFAIYSSRTSTTAPSTPLFAMYRSSPYPSSFPNSRSSCTNRDGQLLVKPQFEVGPSRICRGGLANSPADHLEVLQRITDQAMKLNLLPLGITHSPRLSRQKNIEYLLHVGYPAASNESSINIPAAVDLAFHEWRNS